MKEDLKIASSFVLCLKIDAEDNSIRLHQGAFILGLMVPFVVQSFAMFLDRLTPTIAE
jgi:hypothetical protein